jgi:hypothetical protein
MPAMKIDWKGFRTDRRTGRDGKLLSRRLRQKKATRQALRLPAERGLHETATEPPRFSGGFIKPGDSTDRPMWNSLPYGTQEAASEGPDRHPPAWRHLPDPRLSRVRPGYRLLIDGFSRQALGNTPLGQLCRQDPRPFEQPLRRTAHLPPSRLSYASDPTHPTIGGTAIRTSSPTGTRR